MRIHIHDREVFVAALRGLLGRMRKQLAGVEFLDLHAAEIAEWKVHFLLLFVIPGPAEGRSPKLHTPGWWLWVPGPRLRRVPE